MRKLPLAPLMVSGLLLAAACLAAPATARAQSATARSSGAFVFGSGNGSGGAGLGIGAAAFIGGLTGVEVAYDLPRFHLEGLLGLDSHDAAVGPLNQTQTQTDLSIGVRAWYHLHQGTNSDFSIGGGFGFVNRSFTGGSLNQIFLEPGAEARVFLTPSFALFGLAGFSMAFGDSTVIGNGFALASQLTAGFGFAYFFR